MKIVFAVAVVALFACAEAGTFFIPRPGSATGAAAGNVNVGTSSGPGGSTQIVSVSSQAGGSAQNGGSSVNSANANFQNAQTIFGNFQNSNTNAISNQFGGR